MEITREVTDAIARQLFEELRLQVIVDKNEEIESLRKDNKALAEEVAYLIDHYRNGIKYDEERNEYICIWTQQQIDNAQCEADDLSKKLGWGKEK